MTGRGTAAAARPDGDDKEDADEEHGQHPPRAIIEACMVRVAFFRWRSQVADKHFLFRSVAYVCPPTCARGAIGSFAEEDGAWLTM
jgi:hypothetical protein